MWDGKERRANCVCTKEKEIKDIHDAIFGNGNGVEAGLQWKVSENTKFISTVERIFWVALTIAMTGAVSAIALFGMTIVRISNGKLG